MKYKRIGRSVLLTISAQAVSILLNFVLNIIVPKFINEYQYSYWQTFVLYLSYVGILHFGLLDGIVLRYAQYDYENLDKKALRSQFSFMVFMNVIWGAILIIASGVLFQESSFSLALLLGIGILTKNIFSYQSYVFQITNRIKHYALLIIGQKALYGIIVIVLLLFRVENGIWYCVADLIGDVVGIVCCFTYNKSVCIGKSLPFRQSLAEVRLSVSSGMKLMIATWSSMFIVGGAKMIIQWRWDSITFGKVAFAFSITTLFITFVNAISVVLFPMLKRVDTEELPEIYEKIQSVLSPLLLTVLVLYFPISFILEIWLPNYSTSLVYLGFLLPTVVYTSKVNLLTTNYLKAYRKETTMLVINITTIITAVIAYLIGAFIFDSILVVLFSAIAAIVARSLASEHVVEKILGVAKANSVILDLGMTILFMACAKASNAWIGALAYLVGMALYYALLRLYRRYRVQTKGFRFK